MFLSELKTAGRVLVFGLITAPAFRSPAQETNGAPPDKSGYNLFNPVPENLMRELSPDRPDRVAIHGGRRPLPVGNGFFQFYLR